MSPELNGVLMSLVSVVTEIRTKALDSKLFEALYHEMDAQHTHLLLHAEFWAVS